MTTTDARPDRQAPDTHPATTDGHGPRIAITVHGTPVPQGSKVANRFGGGVRDANATRLHKWRSHLTAHITDQGRYTDPLAGPCRVWVRFTFDRPKSHYRAGRNAALLTSTAPAYPGRSAGDIDKLVRAVLDAATDAPDVLWADDTQVVDLRARKFYAGEHELALDQAGVTLIVEELA